MNTHRPLRAMRSIATDRAFLVGVLILVGLISVFSIFYRCPTCAPAPSGEGSKEELSQSTLAALNAAVAQLRQITDQRGGVRSASLPEGADDAEAAGGEGEVADANSWQRIEARKLHVYYHVAQLGNWTGIAKEQLDHVISSGLADQAAVHVRLVGDAGPLPEVEHPAIHFEHRGALELIRSEFPTLELLHDDCVAHPDRFVLYIHSKGTRGKWEGGFIDAKTLYRRQASWRRVMMYFMVGYWQQCVQHLNDSEGYHTCGINLFPFPYNATFEWPAVRHYSGNFWWARCDFIAGLPALRALVDYEHVPATGLTHQQRVVAEGWLARSPLFPEDKWRLFECFNTRISFYRQDYPESRHRGRDCSTPYVFTPTVRGKGR